MQASHWRDEDVVGHRERVAQEALHHRMDQVGLFERLVGERPEHALLRDDRERQTVADHRLPLLEQHAALGVGARVGADQHDAFDARRMPQREFLRDHAAHERAEHVRAFDADRVEQANRVVGEVGGREGTAGILARADAAVVVGDGAVGGGEVRDLQRVPAARRTAESDDQQQRRSARVAVDLVVEFVGADARMGHARILSRRGA